ncbi:hypothetical protein RRG08_055559 [Elysia crispata]|uniref:Uncharacterized protein n=1 Tax=Elysia crispata TaxID=231223 RepID=A0AAE1DWN6_9GAST|nr:hypothetical protein RRG08_055559 [Elysia crispata]
MTSILRRFEMFKFIPTTRVTLISDVITQCLRALSERFRLFITPGVDLNNPAWRSDSNIINKLKVQACIGQYWSLLFARTPISQSEA